MLRSVSPIPSPSPQLDEPVPSRYSLDVGDIYVTVISDGVLMLPTETMSTNVDKAARAQWFDDMCLPPDAFGWPLNVLVAEAGGKTVLVDAGLGAEYPDFPKAGKLPGRLAAAGIDLSTVTDIVITHMHMDHVGGLLVDGVRAQLNPNVVIHVAAAEVDFWTAPDFTLTTMPAPVPGVLRSAAARFVDEYKSHLRVFDTTCEVAPGVVVRRTGGHTPGHSIVELESKQTRLTFAGDAVFPVGFDHPDWHNGFEHDPEDAMRVRIELLREMAASRDLLVATHLPFPSLGRVSIEGDKFRWIPIIWDY